MRKRIHLCPSRSTTQTTVRVWTQSNRGSISNMRDRPVIYVSDRGPPPSQLQKSKVTSPPGILTPTTNNNCRLPPPLPTHGRYPSFCLPLCQQSCRKARIYAHGLFFCYFPSNKAIPLTHFCLATLQHLMPTEVYPLIGVVTVACTYGIGIAAYALKKGAVGVIFEYWTCYHRLTPPFGVTSAVFGSLYITG